MNIQEYISSGIIESYVLGMASEKEKTEFEKLSEKYPALQKARIEFELTLEEEAFLYTIQPPAELKTRIFDIIRQEAAVQSATRIVSIAPESTVPVKKMFFSRFAVAASIIVLLGCAILAYTFYAKNERLKREMASSQEMIDALDQKKTSIEKELERRELRESVSDIAPAQVVPASIEVFDDSTSTNIYLIVRGLKVLPANEQYEAWSVTDKKYKSLGLFDAPKDDKLIIRANNAKSADSFLISIHKRP